MNRRLALSVLLATGAESLAAPFAVRRVRVRRLGPQVRSVRLLLFVGRRCSGCKAVHRVLDDTDFIRPNWTRGYFSDRHIQYVDNDEDHQLSEKYQVHTLPCFILIKDGIEIGRVDPDVEGWDPYVFVRLGCSLYNGEFPEVAARLMGEVRPLVTWEQEPIQRPQVIVRRPVLQREAGYPIRPDWPFDGWIERPWTHLAHNWNHSGNFPFDWLQTLTWAETQSLHGDHHRELHGTGRVHWESVPKSGRPQFARS